MNILYVEDEQFTRILVKKLLEKESLNVNEAANGVIGLKKFFEIKPDIIITDLAMPEMDGFEMITRIRQHDQTIPIIITTAYREEASRVSTMINACIYKPIIKEDLLEAIYKLKSA